MSEPIRPASRADQRRARHHKQVVRLLGASMAVVLVGAVVFGAMQLTSDGAPTSGTPQNARDRKNAKTPEGVLANSHEIVIPTTPEAIKAANEMDRPPAEPGSKVWCQMNNSPQPECPAP